MSVSAWKVRAAQVEVREVIPVPKPPVLWFPGKFSPASHPVSISVGLGARAVLSPLAHCVDDHLIHSFIHLFPRAARVFFFFFFLLAAAAVLRWRAEAAGEGFPEEEALCCVCAGTREPVRAHVHGCAWVAPLHARLCRARVHTHACV